MSLERTEELLKRIDHLCGRGAYHDVAPHQYFALTLISGVVVFLEEEGEVTAAGRVERLLFEKVLP